MAVSGRKPSLHFVPYNGILTAMSTLAPCPLYHVINSAPMWNFFVVALMGTLQMRTHSKRQRTGQGDSTVGNTLVQDCYTLFTQSC